jgi:hypothetical protein
MIKRILAICIFSCVLLAPLAQAVAQGANEPAAPGATNPAAGVVAKDGQPNRPPPPPTGGSKLLEKRTVAWITAVATLILLAVATGRLWRAAQPGESVILTLNTSFFFWLGMTYMTLLLLLAVCYTVSDIPRGYLIGGVLPVAVPWFGALGAVTISLQGVFMWNQRWDKSYNYWHIGRPLFGAALGIVAFFAYVVLVSASGTPPKIWEANPTPHSRDCIVFYLVAFLVGYREETFRELIKGVTDLIFKPGGQRSETPSVTFEGPGVSGTEITLPAVAAGAQTRCTLHVKNVGSLPLIAPAVAVTGPFTLSADQVSGPGPLAPGQSPTVNVDLQAQKAGTIRGTLILTASNLAAPRSISVVATVN